MSNSASWKPDFERDFETETETRESVLRAQISILCSLALSEDVASLQLSYILA